MNKIVVDHYPSSKLPPELRAGLNVNASVRITIEEETTRPIEPRKLLDLMRRAQGNAKGTSLSDAVARIRSLRDEWED